jgi:alpha-galactosidase
MLLLQGLDGMTPYGVPASNKCPPHVASCKPGVYISREDWGAVGGLTLTQQRSHFSLWVMMSSPLIIGNDPRLLRSNVRELLTAPEVLAIHADALGRQARRIYNQGALQLWKRELSGSSRFALLVLNAKDKAIDLFDVLLQEHFADMHATWARNVSGLQLLPRCEDEDTRCSEWAASGECSRNPGFMLSKCKKSCPKACADHTKQLASGTLASALVRDTWAREDLGLATGRIQVKHLEPYEGRLLVLQFVDPLRLDAGVGGWQALVGGGVSGTAGYTQSTTSARSSGSSSTGAGATTGSEVGSVAGQVAAAAGSAGQAAAAAAAAVAAAAAAVPGSAAESAARELQRQLFQSKQRLVQLMTKAQRLGASLEQPHQQLLQHAHGTTLNTGTAAAVASDFAGAAIGGGKTGGEGVATSSAGRTHVEDSSRTRSSGLGQPVDQHIQQHKLGGIGWLSSLGVNACVLCLGFALGVATHKHRRMRRGYGGHHWQPQLQQNSMKLY